MCLTFCALRTQNIFPSIIHRLTHTHTHSRPRKHRTVKKHPNKRSSFQRSKWNVQNQYFEIRQLSARWLYGSHRKCIWFGTNANNLNRWPIKWTSITILYTRCTRVTLIWICHVVVGVRVFAALRLIIIEYSSYNLMWLADTCMPTNNSAQSHNVTEMSALSAHHRQLPSCGTF